MKQKYKVRTMPESVFFLSCDGENGEKWYDISFNGAGYPKIEEVERMKIAISNLLVKMENLGQEKINIINKEIEKEQYEEMYGLNRGSKTIKKRQIQEKVKGYIYLVKCRNLYKIGRALDIKNRIKTYKTENPFGIDLIFQKEVEDYIGIEQKLLSNFQHKRIGGEWFKLNQEDILWIKENL